MQYSSATLKNVSLSVAANFRRGAKADFPLSHGKPSPAAREGCDKKG